MTIPRAFPGISSRNVAFGGRATMAALRALAAAVDHRVLTPARAARLAARAERVAPDDFARSLRPGLLPPIFALAVGTREDRSAAVGCALAQLPGTIMGEVTGIPLGVALGLLPNAEPGVHVPETLLDPDAFFAAWPRTAWAARIPPTWWSPRAPGIRSRNASWTTRSPMPARFWRKAEKLRCRSNLTAPGRRSLRGR